MAKVESMKECMLKYKVLNCIYVCLAAPCLRGAVVIMSSDSDSDDESVLPVQLLLVHSLSSYLQSEEFSKSDVQELVSVCRMNWMRTFGMNIN